MGAEVQPGGRVVSVAGAVDEPSLRQFTRAKQPEAGVFLDGLAEGMTPQGAAVRARIHRSVAYRWRETDQAFREAWERAYAAGTEFFEEEAKRRAILGTEEPVWYQGKQVGTVRKPSDRLMELMLKARAPEKYRERVDIQHSAAPMSPAELQAAREAGMRPEVEAAARVIAALPATTEKAADAG